MFILLISKSCVKVTFEKMTLFCCCSVAKSCPILCDPRYCSPPGSSVHSVFQARILEWVVISFSRGSSWTRDQTCVSCIEGGFFTVWAQMVKNPLSMRDTWIQPKTWYIVCVQTNTSFLPWFLWTVGYSQQRGRWKTKHCFSFPSLVRHHSYSSIIE